MLMMKPTPVTKMPKPPPPVPPRPNKNIIAEALAKTRKLSPEINSESANKQTNGKIYAPIRSAPPPPVPQTTTIIKNGFNNGQEILPPIVKSQSYAAVNLYNKQAPKIERSLSHTEEETKNSTRTVIFQSCNMKKPKVELKFAAVDPEKRPPMVINSESSVKRTPSIKKNGEIEQITPTVTKLETTITDTNHVNDNKDDCNPDKAETNWNDILNGKNHVNTLIDEMFASILDIADEKCDYVEAMNENINTSLLSDLDNDILVSADKTKIIVSNSVTDNTVTKSTITCDISDEQSNATVLIINDSEEENKVNGEHEVTIESSEMDSENASCSSMSSTGERNGKRVHFDDQMNHEFLIAELQNMRKEQERILRRQRKPSQEIYDEFGDEKPKIQHSDWVEVSDGREVRLSSCQITIEDRENAENSDAIVDPLISRLSSMSSLHGLPPLPKSLSGFSLLENPRSPSRISSSRGATPPTPGSGSGHVVYPPHPRTVNGVPEAPSGRKPTNLDTQLAILRREMYSLRQLDLSLLSQLWSLNESIQDFRQMLQDQDDRALSPPSPSPSPSSCDDGEADEFYSPSPIRLRPAPPPPPLRRSSNSSSANSSEYGTV